MLHFLLEKIATSLFVGSLLVVSSQAEEKPNVFFIFSDDQAYETIGAYELTDIDTPNLERLVNEGG